MAAKQSHHITTYTTPNDDNKNNNHIPQPAVKSPTSTSTSTSINHRQVQPATCAATRESNPTDAAAATAASVQLGPPGPGPDRAEPILRIETPTKHQSTKQEPRPRPPRTHTHHTPHTNMKTPPCLALPYCVPCLAPSSGCCAVGLDGGVLRWVCLPSLLFPVPRAGDGELPSRRRKATAARPPVSSGPVLWSALACPHACMYATGPAV